MAECADPRNIGAAEQAQLLSELESVMWAGVGNILTALLPVFASLLRADQFAAYAAACAPWLPSLVSLRGALVRLREEVAEGADGGGSVVAPDSGAGNHCLVFPLLSAARRCADSKTHSTFHG